mmetsp:Transcript_4872/g.31170  ORF Transcript_4872/g.31170 Transcript_4872/m.31170 type:complete len:87 (-) Transcript_4872:4153-4413(-)
MSQKLDRNRALSKRGDPVDLLEMKQLDHDAIGLKPCYAYVTNGSPTGITTAKQEVTKNGHCIAGSLHEFHAHKTFSSYGKWKDSSR